MEVLIVLPLREIAQVLSSAYKSIKEHINLVKHGHQLYVTDAVPIHIDVIAMGFFVWIGNLFCEQRAFSEQKVWRYEKCSLNMEHSK